VSVVLAGLLWIGLTLLALGARAEKGAHHGAPPRVLILDSYHRGEAWSDDELTGISETLSKVAPDAELLIESLDAKRHPKFEQILSFKRLLAVKYGHGSHRPHLVMVLDNPALEFILEFREELFPGIPVVFAGINNFRPELIQGHDGITGVAEVQDMAGTLRLVLALHPEVRRILAVHDHTSSGLAVKRDMVAAMEQLQGRVQVDFTPEATMEELQEILRKLPRDSVAMILSFVTDSQGHTFSRKESTEIITSASPVPVYAMHETRMGAGIVGGYLLSGAEHGRQAAELAREILAGEEPARLSVVQSRSSPMFDFRVLRRFGLSELRLPEGSVVLYKPVSFYQKYLWWIWGSVGVFSLESMLIFYLVVQRRRSRAAEASLRESEAKYKLILENSSDIVWTMNGEGLFTYVSAALKKVLGYDVGQWVGKHPESFVHPDDFPVFREGLQGVIGDQRVTAGVELRVRHAEGAWIWVSTNATPVLDNHGRFGSAVGISREISLQKRLEADRLEFERQLQQSRKLESLGRMAGAVAHHFNNLLAAAMGNLEMVLEDLMEGRRGSAEEIMEALKAGRRASKLTRMLTSYLGHSSGVRQRLDLSVFCREAMPLLRLSVPDPVELKTELSESGLFVEAVPDQVHQILANLVTNAWEAMDKGGGEVRVALYMVGIAELNGRHFFPAVWQPSEPEYVCLSISDNGCGIPLCDRDRIFDPFFSTKFTGRGLGLPVVLGGAMAMGGAVSFETEVGVGSVFRVLFPLAVRRPGKGPEEAPDRADVSVA
jgi:PAS domain S-box-containing protein